MPVVVLCISCFNPDRHRANPTFRPAGYGNRLNTNKEQIRQRIIDNLTLSARRDVAMAFGIMYDIRIDLKRTLREIDADVIVEKSARVYGERGVLPPAAVLEILAPAANGDLFALRLEEEV